MSRRSWLSCCLALAVAACASDAEPLTQIVAVVDSDLAVPTALDRVTIRVSGVVQSREATADLTEEDLPRSLGLVHSGGPLGPVRVVARGFRGSTLVVERLAIVAFERGKSLELRLPLSAACASATLECGDDMTCERGECAPAEQESLPAFSGSVSGFDVDAPDGGGSDAGLPGDNQKPECTISMPSDGATFAEGESVTLAGSCEDPESGPIRLGLSWQSDLTSTLGTGARISVTALPAGARTISLCARDPRQPTLRGCASIAITVERGASVQALPELGMRFDSLATASNDRVYAAAQARRELYAFEGGAAASAPALAMDQGQLPDIVRDIALDETLGLAYLASKGFLVCPFATDSGIAAAGCSTFRGGMLASDDCNAVLRVSGANSTNYLLVGTTKGILVTTPDATGGGNASGTRRLPSADVRALAAVNGVAWLATSQGLYSLEPSTGTSERFGVASGAPSDALNALASDSAGALWVGSSNGLGRFNPSTRSWTVWRAGAAAQAGPLSNEIRDIVVVATSVAGVQRDIVWIATAAGVSRFDPSPAAFTSFTQADGLPSDSVRAITVLSNGTKLFATDTGVVSYGGI